MNSTITQTKNALIIFIKFPKLGKVKTRLASSTNDVFALEVYKLLAENIFKEAEKLDSDIFVFYDGSADKQRVKNWVNKNFIYSPQNGKDLGEKMLNAFEQVKSKGFEKILIIGSDVPDISKDLITNSLNELNKTDVVISPSDDGGYSLLGLKEINSFLFQNIEWSTQKVLNQTIEAIKQNKLSLTKLKTLNDIDTKEELIEWISKTKNMSLKTKILKIAERNNIIL
ncbi:MAG: TIGR04282 family arsenosugar biosynthesis glycosyltransferase [Ignavibacteriae bacterium]|nr:TIGR04282 family arsenosugar biosynthesis glycosyltransferase [Ignavibacteriota bacterium]